MKRIINPCFCDVGNSVMARAYCSIEYENNVLSITGVVRPRSNGDAYSCGQIIDDIKNGKLTDDWTKEMLDKFVDIWENYHLNDLRPYCEHQKELGWKELSTKQIIIYEYHLKTDVLLKKKEMCAEDKDYLKYKYLKYAIRTHLKYDELDDDIRDFYEKKYEEHKNLGWTYPNEHPEGLLTKECPVCEYKYGTMWKKEEVPQDIIRWLFSLPTSQHKPAWV